MLSYSIWFSAPSFWMGGGLESRCVGRVYGVDGAVRRRAAPSAFFKVKNFSQSFSLVLFIWEGLLKMRLL